MAITAHSVCGCEVPLQITGGLFKNGALNQYRILRRHKGGGFHVLMTFLKCDWLSYKFVLNVEKEGRRAQQCSCTL